MHTIGCRRQVTRAASAVSPGRELGPAGEAGFAEDAGVDVTALLRQARERCGLSQAQLAARADTSRAAVSQYETGRKSPTVVTLNRILAAAGLQIRAELEPLRAALDVRVDAVLAAVLAAGEPLDASSVQPLAEALLSEPVTWGLDGETALRAHGLGFSSQLPQAAIALDDAARAYFFRARVRGTGGDPVSWFEADLPAAQAYLGGMALGPFGMVAVRLVAKPPKTVSIEVAPGLVVPVLTVEEVERGRPDLAEVLQRLRDRRGEERT